MNMSTYASEKLGVPLPRASEKRIRICASQILRPRLLSLVVLLVMFGSDTSGVSAPLQGDRELLRIVRDGYQANIERVITWQGYAEVTSQSENMGYDRRKMESRVEFVYDRGRQAVRWNWMTSADEAVVDNTPKRLRRTFLNKMLKDGTLYRFGPFDPVRKDKPYTLNIDSMDGFRAVNTSDDFDPRVCLTHPTGSNGPSIIDLLNMYYDKSDDPDIDAKVTRDGNKVILHVDNESASLVTRLEFDLTRGCALISYSVAAPVGGQTHSYEYEQSNGAFVPKRFIYKLETRAEGARTKTRVREMVFTRNSVNEPIPESEFSLESLGVRPGDHISDRFIGVAYAYKAMPPLPKLGDNAGEPDLAFVLPAAEKGRDFNQVTPAAAADVNQKDPASRAPAADPAGSAADTRRRTATSVILFAACMGVIAVCGVTAFVRRKRTISGKEQDV